ncbi:pheromone A receptor-domain-containing protein [Cyathus striatus]|nr:pheromone A receptor-domain-containing protein [Cyathus striatus]
MAWTGIGSLIFFINSIVWNGNAINVAPVWCDITAKYIVGLSWAIQSCSLCINRRLYHIASVRSVTITRAEKRRQIMVDLAIGIGLPVLGMILHIIPQGHRFDIFGDIGCYPTVYVTPMAYALVFGPPVVIGLVSAVYSFLTIRAFYKTHTQFQEILSRTGNITKSRYIRLMLLAGFDILGNVPLSCYIIYSNARIGTNPWLGWADTHEDFWRIRQYPTVVWRDGGFYESAMEAGRYLTPVCAIAFFIFFGFAEEARKNYRSAIDSVAKRVGMSTSFSSGGTTNGSATDSTGFFKSWTKSGSSSGRPKPVLPIFVHKEYLEKRDSMLSFTDVESSTSFTESDKEKSFSPDASFGALSLNDVGGTLADYNDSPYSSAPSGSSNPSHLEVGAAHARPESLTIEVSSVRRASIAPPEPAVLKSKTDSPV